jgi:hypothetical protein
MIRVGSPEGLMIKVVHLVGRYKIDDVGQDDIVGNACF